MMVGGYCMCACFIALMLSKFLAKPSFKNGHLYILLVFFVFTEKKNELFRPSGNLLRPVVLHEILFFPKHLASYFIPLFTPPS